MPVFLTSNPTIFAQEDLRIAISGVDTAHSNFLDLSVKLEAAFTNTYETWREIALVLQAQPTAEYAHMPTLSTYASDFGVMLAWLRVIEDAAQSKKTTFVFCTDPWLFQALQFLPHVQADKAPRYWIASLRSNIRGYLARTRAALLVLCARWKLRHHRNDITAHENWLLVYGHPDSNAQGHDAYFSDLMSQFPTLKRMMHTDCGVTTAAKLARNGRTKSLHSWGSYSSVITLPFTKWRPNTSTFDSKIAWLIKRAAAIEGQGGSAAMTKWQIHCQFAWLKSSQPQNVSWPWENHPWERAFVRQTRRLNTHTLGYQHTVVGRHMFNQGADANIDGLDSIPDQILLNGPAYKDDLVRHGIPDTRMTIIGAHRINTHKLPTYSQTGPVFLALSNNPGFAQQMIDAARPLAEDGLPFIVKDHPLSPYDVQESINFTHSRVPLDQLPPLRAVVYCTGTTGLEGILANIPTLRFIPDSGVAMDILPANVEVSTVTASNLKTKLNTLSKPVISTANNLFPPPDIKKWRHLLETTPLGTDHG